MVAYSFKRRFVEPIRSGCKRQTIRAHRRRHAHPGEQLQLYCGMRTRNCFLIGRGQCSSLLPVTLQFVINEVVFIGNAPIRGEELNEFARRDGFESWQDLRDFWRVEHPSIDRFDGMIIFWELLPP